MKNILISRSRALPLLAAALLATTSQAAVITFSSATTISGDSDILTEGSLIYGYAMSNLTRTVNGVNFSASGVAGGTYSSVSIGGGNISVMNVGGVGNDQATSTTGSFAALSPNYQAILTGSVFKSAGVLTVVFNNLTAGQEYKFQVLTSEPRDAFKTRTGGIRRVDDSGAVALDYNVRDVLGGLGQYSVGSFIADDTSQSFEMFGGTGGVAQFNAIQLRAVPEPATYGLMGAGILAGVAFVRRRRKSV